MAIAGTLMISFCRSRGHGLIFSFHKTVGHIHRHTEMEVKRGGRDALSVSVTIFSPFRFLSEPRERKMHPSSPLMSRGFPKEGSTLQSHEEREREMAFLASKLLADFARS